MQLSDAELLKCWQSGDVAAGEKLFQQYFRVVERFFLNKVGESVDDLVQETFLACLQSVGRLVDYNNFRSYLFAIAYRVLATYLRRRYREGKRIDFDEISIHNLAPGVSSLMVRRDEQRLLLEALRYIPVSDQIILELHYWESMTTSEIAEVLDLPVGTVRGRLRRARELLEQALAELADSPTLLQSTLTDLDDWARAVRRNFPSPDC